MPLKIREILEKRGLSDEAQVRSWLYPSLKSLKDPSLLKDMDRSVDRLVLAHLKQESVCVYADFDLDGTSGLALLVEGFQALGFEKTLWYQPKRLADGYGLHAEAMDDIRSRGASVVVTVDVGITGFEAAIRARELGMDLIITDHHLPKEELPKAFSVVNPNRRDCTSQLGYLSGAGVAFYLLLALRRKLLDSATSLGESIKNQIQDFDPKILLDFFVIGTLTDMVSLKNENRVLTKHGLLQIQNTKRPGLRRLLKELKMEDRPLSSADVAIGLAPKLNALSRMERGLLPADLLLAKADEAEDMVLEAMEINQSRKDFQKKAEDEAMILAQDQYQNGFVWVYSKDFHKGIIGLVATKISQEFGVPALVGSINSEGIVTGSGRLPNGSAHSLIEILTVAKDSLIKFGGHRMAAGFKLQLSEAENLRPLWRSFFIQTSPEGKEQLEDEIFELSLKEITPAFLEWYQHLEPFGADFESPIFLFRNIQVKSARRLRGGHWKAQFQGESQSLDGLYFHPPAGFEFGVGQVMDLWGSLQWNYYGGVKRLQIAIKRVFIK